MKKIISVFSLAIFLSITNSIYTYADASYTGFLYTYQGNDYMMVPARGVFQSMSAEVQWIESTQKIQISKNGLKISLQINNTNALVNGENKQMPVPPIIKNDTTYLPLRFLSEIIGGNKVEWDQTTQTALIPYNGSHIYVKAVDYNNDITSFTQKVEGITATIVKIPANSGYRPAAVLANNKVGSTQSLYDMAKYYSAVAAINGTFFSAYDGHPDPWNTIIKDGKVIHVGNIGTVFGFTGDGRVKMDKLRINIVGSTNGSYNWPNNWYAYGFNHMPAQDGSSVYIFTPDWGTSLGFNYGINIVVENGTVTNIVENQDVNIPSNGYVINLNGDEKYLAKTFWTGKSVDYKINFKNANGDDVDWSDVVTAIGAGPTLIKNGDINVDPTSEGFTEAKILSLSYARSAIGVTKQGDILLVTVPSATIYQLAHIMKDLGSYNAMNLDGGASSGLYFKGSYLTKPGRNLSNALIFYK